MKGFAEGDDFVAAFARWCWSGMAEAASEFDEAVICFRPGVSEEDFTGELNAFFDDEFSEVGLVGILVEVGEMEDLFHLFLHGLRLGGVRVAERAGRDAHAEVEVALSVVIPQAGAFAFYHRDRKAGVGAEDVLGGFFRSSHECRLDKMLGICFLRMK